MENMNSYGFQIRLKANIGFELCIDPGGNCFGNFFHGSCKDLPITTSVLLLHCFDKIDLIGEMYWPSSWVVGTVKPLLRSFCILYDSLFFRADTTTLYIMVLKWGSSVNDVLACNSFYDFWVRGQFFPFINMQGHQHQRTFQLPFQQLDLLHLVPSLPSSLHRGNRSNPPRTFWRTPQKHRGQNLPVTPLLSTLMD